MNQLVTILSGEERVEAVYALAQAAKNYKELAAKIDNFLSMLDDKPLEMLPDGYLIKILEEIPEFTLPVVTYWKQKLNVRRP